MTENKEQNTNKKRIIIIIAVIVAITVIAAVIITLSSKEGKDVAREKSSVEVITLENGETITSEELVTLESVEIETKQDNDDPWEDMTVIEETEGDNYMKDEDGNPMTDEQGEFVTESYPGEGSGWSPMVPVDELNTK